MKRKTLLSLILALLLLLPIGAALAAPPLPATFYGSVTLNGANVPEGTEITAWINGTQYAVIASQRWDLSSVYGPLDVPGDDPDTPEVEGGVAGDLIVFKIGTQEADQTATWQSGGGGELNLTATDDTNHLTCDDVELYLNQTVNLTLIANGTDVYGLQATVATDGSVAQVESASFGDFFSDIAAGANQVSDNSWYGAASQQNPAPPVSGSGTFATLTYTGVSPGTTEVTLEALFSDRDGFELQGSTTTCTITVLDDLDDGNITGNVIHQGRFDHANIEVFATGPVTETALTDSAGNFELDQLPAGDYALKADAPLYLPTCTTSDVSVTSGETVTLVSTRLLGGDVNDNVESDLVINIGDATLVAANLDPSNPPADLRADINADGVVNVQDWSILQGNYEASGCQDW